MGNSSSTITVGRVGAASSEYPHRHIKGYPGLALFTAVDPHTFHVRGFHALSARTILYLQAELGELEDRLLDAEDADSNTPGREEYSKKWQRLRDSTNESEHTQIEILGRVMEILPMYQKAIMRHRRLYLEGVNKFHLGVVQNFLDNRTMFGRASLLGDDASNWGSTIDSDGHAPDLFAVIPERTGSYFEMFLKEKIAPMFFHEFHSHWKKPNRYGFFDYDGNWISYLAVLIGILALALLTIISINALYLVHSTAWKLVLISVAYGLFLGCSCILFDDRMFIVAISTAFVAALVALMMNGNS